MGKSLNMDKIKNKPLKTMTTEESLKDIIPFTITSSPWKPQDLIDDIQEMIDEESDSYTNSKWWTLCTARDYLIAYFRTGLMPEDVEKLKTK